MSVYVDASSIMGRLTLRDAIERTYRHLQAVVAEGFVVRNVCFAADNNFHVRIDPPHYMNDGGFWVLLPFEEVQDLDGVALFDYLTKQLVGQMPNLIRLKCSEALDDVAVQIEKPTRAQLWERLEECDT